MEPTFASSAQLSPIDPLCAGVESILPVVDTPVAAEGMAQALDAPASDARDALREIKYEYHTRHNGIEPRKADEGWRFYTAPIYVDAVERFLLDGSQSEFLRAAMETLVVAVYRQPATCAQISGVHGVNVNGVIHTPVARGLIAGSREGPATDARLYVTTMSPLELLGIDSSDQLPGLAPPLPEIDLADEPLDQAGLDRGAGLAVLSEAQRGSLHRLTHFTTRVSPHATSTTAMR